MEHLPCLPGADRKRLLAKDVFSGSKGGDRQLMVRPRRRGYRYGIHVTSVNQLVGVCIEVVDSVRFSGLRGLLSRPAANRNDIPAFGSESWNMDHGPETGPDDADLSLAAWQIWPPELVWKIEEFREPSISTGDPTPLSRYTLPDSTQARSNTLVLVAPASNQPVAHLPDILARHGEERWMDVLIVDGRNRAGLICSPEGTPGDPHLHPDFNEWWVILGGETTFQVGEYEPIVARFGDIVIAPAGYRHDIRPSRGQQCLRLVVGPPWSNHDLKGVPPSRTIPHPTGLKPPNLVHTPLEWMIERNGTEKDWAELVLLDQRNRANMIHQRPRGTNRAHWHPNCWEWWVVLKGELEWRVGKRSPFRATRGDIVYVEAGLAHEIVTVGDESSIRLAVTNPDIIHYFLDNPDHPRPPRH